MFDNFIFGCAISHEQIYVHINEAKKIESGWSGLLDGTGCLVDFCRPAAVLNLKQPAEIVPKKQKQATTFQNARIAEM